MRTQSRASYHQIFNYLSDYRAGFPTIKSLVTVLMRIQSRVFKLFTVQMVFNRIFFKLLTVQMVFNRMFFKLLTVQMVFNRMCFKLLTVHMVFNKMFFKLVFKRIFSIVNSADGVYRISMLF